MKTVAPQILALKEGEVLLHRIRKVNRRDANGQPIGGQYKMSLEFVAGIKLPNQRQSALSIFNQGDERFARNGKIAYAYLIAEPETACKLLGLDIQAFNELEISTKTPSAMWLEKVHTITVDLMNPQVPNEGRLFVQYVETTVPPREGAIPLVNPSTGEIVMSQDGSPIYTNSQVIVLESHDQLHHIVVERMSKAQQFQMLANPMAVKEMEEQPA